MKRANIKSNANLLENKSKLIPSENLKIIFLWMKKMIFIGLLFIVIPVCFANEPIKFNFLVESAFVSPLKLSEYSGDFRSGYSTGAGVCLMKDIWKCFSGDMGLTFRLKSFQQVMTGYLDADHNYHHEPDQWMRFQQNQIAIPLHVRTYLTKRFFLLAGLEHAFILDPKDIKKKSEDNWLLGFGGNPGRFNWSLSYMEGFQERGVVREIGNKTYSSGYKNRMIQLSFSYSFWQKK